jgi:hypothetical protein
MPSDTKIINFQADAVTQARIKRLKILTELTSASEVIRTALRHLEGKFAQELHNS